MGSVWKANLSLLKQKKNNFNNEKTKFMNTTYNTFSSSYLNSCSDYHISLMSQKLNSLYQEIKESYTKIDLWWDSYNSNLESLEKFLSGDVSSGSISEVSVRNYVASKMDLIDDYNKKNNTNYAQISTKEDGLITNSIINNLSKLYSEYDTIKSTVSNSFVNLMKDETKTNVAQVVMISSENILKAAYRTYDESSKKLSDWWNNELIPWFNSISNNVSSKLKDTGANIEKVVKNAAKIEIQNQQAQMEVNQITGATAITFGASIIEGIANFGESIIDAAATFSTAVGNASNFDAYMQGAISFEDYQNYSNKMWNDTRGFVEEEYVTNFANSIYENTEAGKYLKENSFGFETVRNVGNGIGYSTSTIALSIFTGGGTVGMASFAGIAGFGSGTEQSWIDGAATEEGLAYGLASGTWESIQYYIGAKIGMDGGWGNQIADKLVKDGVANSTRQVTTSIARVVMDGIDGGIEGFIQPALQSIYKDGSYTELFESNGGWSYVATNTVVGAGTSTISEVFDLAKFFKNKDATIESNNIANNLVDLDEIESQMILKTSKKQELINLRNSSEYLEYMDNARKGYAQRLRPEFEGIEEKILNIETEIDNLSKIRESKVNNIGDITDKIFDEDITDKIDPNATVELVDVPKNETIESINEKVKTQFFNTTRTNERIIKSEILDTVKEIEDPILKLRKLYNELNNRIHYDMEYIVGDQQIKKRIFEENITFDNLTGNRVVCSGWSQLYKELLIDAGFDSNKVSIIGKNHKWIEVDLGDNILIADATDAINGSIDLSNCKAGFVTNGFIMLNKSYSGTRLSKVYDNFDLSNYNNWLKKVDEQLGYVNNDRYYGELLEKTKTVFGDSSIINKIFGNKIFEKNIERIFDISVPSNMNGYESFTYYKKIMKNMFTETELRNINLRFLYNSTSTMVEPITVLKVETPNLNKILVYSESTGKMIFDSESAFNEYKRTLNLVSPKK